MFHVLTVFKKLFDCSKKYPIKSEMKESIERTGCKHLSRRSGVSLSFCKKNVRPFVISHLIPHQFNKNKKAIFFSCATNYCSARHKKSLVHLVFFNLSLVFKCLYCIASVAKIRFASEYYSYYCESSCLVLGN